MSVTSRVQCAIIRVRVGRAMLREAVSSVGDYEFEIEEQLEKQVGTRPLPFPKMDSKWAV